MPKKSNTGANYYIRAKEKFRKRRKNLKNFTAKIVSFLLVTLLLFTAIACGGKEDSTGSSSSTGGGVTPTPTPTPTPTAEEMLDEYREKTDDKISDILYTDNLDIPSTATVYYVSNDGDDSKDGLTESNAWRTLSKVNAVGLQAGDYVCFERGGLWRGQLIAKKGVTYTAYGDVANGKPVIYGSPENGTGKNNWIQTETKNVWRYKNPFDEDVGTIVFNDGEYWGVKAVVTYQGDKYYNSTRFKYDDKGAKNSSYAEAWSGTSELKNDLDFWHNDVSFGDNKADNYVYLYSEGNPGERFWAIEFSVKHHLAVVKCDDVTIDNLCFKYTGAHGVSAENPKNLTVQNCEFGWIGGSLQTATPKDSVRYGNAVQVWLSCNGFYVKNNYVYQCYDTGITPQGTVNQLTDLVEKNIEITENVIEYCNYGLEFFVTAEKNNYSHFENVSISKNHIWYSGYGLCEQRPDLHDNGHVIFWRGPWKNQMTEKVKITDNVMGLAKMFIVNTQYGAEAGPYKNTSGFIYQGNVIIDYDSARDTVDNTAIGWGGYDFLGSNKRFCVIREWIDGADRWKTYYDDLQFYNEDFTTFLNTFTDGGKENVCYFLTPEE